MKSLFSLFLRVLAVVVYVQFISSQFYDPTGDGVAETIYRILDPLLVLGMIIVVYYAYQRKRAVDATSDVSVTREYLEANGVLYVGVALFFGLLWNWIGFQFVDPTNSHGWLWTLIDLALPLLFFASSVQLLKEE
ncbi:MAG: hypothetical protein OXC27_15320 [Caldilineaceae bacterium]|nr:hypothetical protein [Caldilineaceae bacterium]